MTAKALDKVILEIVTNNRPKDQKEMLSVLAERGFEINQSTLSRHLKKMKIRKQDGRYRYVGDSQGGFSDAQSVKELIMVPPNLIIVKTLPGHANAFSWRLDERAIHGIVGTVAGDDTVFIAVAGPDLVQPVHDAVAMAFHLD